MGTERRLPGRDEALRTDEPTATRHCASTSGPSAVGQEGVADLPAPSAAASAMPAVSSRSNTVAPSRESTRTLQVHAAVDDLGMRPHRRMTPRAQSVERAAARPRHRRLLAHPAWRTRHCSAWASSTRMSSPSAPCPSGRQAVLRDRQRPHHLVDAAQAAQAGHGEDHAIQAPLRHGCEARLDVPSQALDAGDQGAPAAARDLRRGEPVPMRAPCGRSRMCDAILHV